MATNQCCHLRNFSGDAYLTWYLPWPDTYEGWERLGTKLAKQVTKAEIHENQQSKKAVNNYGDQNSDLERSAEHATSSMATKAHPKAYIIAPLALQHINQPLYTYIKIQNVVKDGDYYC